MSYLVNERRRIYHLGAVEVWGSVMSWQVEYWIRPADRGRAWQVYRRGEGERARECSEIKLADEVREYVRSELGVEVSGEDWIEMGWTERAAEEAAEMREKDVADRACREADARAELARERRAEEARDAALEQAELASLNAATRYMEALRRKGGNSSSG